MVGVQIVDLIQHIREELVSSLKNADCMKRLSLIGKHVIKSVSCKLLDSVLDHSVGNENIAYRVFIMVWDAKKICIVA